MEDLLEQTWECASCREARADEDDRTSTTDGDVCDSCRENYYSWCDDCETCVPTEDTRWVEAGAKVVCEDCLGRYYTMCDECEEHVSDSDRYNVDNGTYCYGCYEGMPYCDRCERTYHEDNSSDHDHGGGCDEDCTPLPLHFTIPVSDASDTVGADQPFTVRLPGGLIPESVLYSVQNMLREACTYDNKHPLYAASLYVHTVGAEWKTDKGTYPKRLRREVYNRTRTEKINRWTGVVKDRHYDYVNGEWRYEHGPWMDDATAKRMAKGYSMPDDIVAKIGAMCEPYSRPVNMEVQATRDINGEADDFCHDSSCWWGDEAHSRCTLKVNGGFGLRTFEQVSNVTWDGQAYEETECTGRAWVLPLRKRDQFHPGPAFVPVTDAVLDASTVDAWAVFNGYGTLSEKVAAQIVSNMTGLPHKHVEADRDDWNMWVNAGAYIVAEQSILDTLPGALYLNLTAHN